MDLSGQAFARVETTILFRPACTSASDPSSQARPEAVPLRSTARQHVRFDLQACLPGGDDSDIELAPTAETIVRVQKRKYQRTEKSRGPRTYRTHPDPFEAVETELHQWFLAAPDRPVKCLLQELQAHYPGRYPDSLLRTLQRRVSGWRRDVILEFDDSLLREDVLLNQSLPAPLRAIPVNSPAPGEMAVENAGVV
jgi:hypothetical protein